MVQSTHIQSIPLVSIGIPVFNGEKYIRYALDSILGQTFRDFELIISDNASTDATADICAEYLQSDPRIKYCRNDINLGAGPNYDICFNKSSGKYFKWCAHDDMVDRTFVEKAVLLLENNLDDVVCVSQIRQIDEYNNTIKIYDVDYPDLSSTRPSQRFRPMIMDMTGCEFFFGVFRRNILEDSVLHGNHINSDKILLAEIALRGPFKKINEPLIFIREHQQRYSRAVYPDRAHSLEWFDAGRKKQKPYRRLNLYKYYFHIINKNVTSINEKILCYKYLLEYIFRKRNIRLLFHDLILAISPGLYYRLNIPAVDRRIR